jgi:tetratricopeptide (TPR) repeat protein
MEADQKKVALVVANLPSVGELELFSFLGNDFSLEIVCPSTVGHYIEQTMPTLSLALRILPEYEENPSYLPGLEGVLSDFDIVIVKERLGLYSYQAIKAKWKNRFKLVVWLDNLAILPADDVDRMRAVRIEVCDAADAFLVFSQSLEKMLLIEGIEKDRILLMTPHVPQTAIRSAASKSLSRQSLGLAEGNFVVSYVGNLEWEEGLCDLLAGLKDATLTNEYLKRQLQIIFCGMGSYANKVAEFALRLGIDDRCHFLTPTAENIKNILEATDTHFYAPCPSRDRIDADPFRVLLPMANGIPLLATRNPITNEFCGKHRIDFCANDLASLGKALIRLVDAENLKKDIVHKNKLKVQSTYNKVNAERDFAALIQHLDSISPELNEGVIDQRVHEVENLVATKQYLKAIEIIESLFKQQNVPRHHEVNLYRLIGDSFTKLADFKGAKEAYLKAIDKDAYAHKAYVGLGTVGLLTNAYELAVIHFQKAVALMPNDEMPSLGLGLAFQGLKEHKEAIKWMQRSLEINPSNTAAIYSMVKVAYEISQFDEALHGVECYLNLHGKDQHMLFTRSGLLFQLGRAEEAENNLRILLSINPQNQNAKDLLVQIQQRMQASKHQSKGA